MQQPATINAATIHAAALAAAAIAPEYDVHACAQSELAATHAAASFHLWDLEDETACKWGGPAHAAGEWARDLAMDEAAGEWFELQQLPPRFLTFQTSERGRHKVRNIRANLEAFAAAVKANQRAFGGGIKPTKRDTPKPAQSWPATAVRVVWEYLQDRNYAAALELAEAKAGALFYNTGGKPFLLWAPQDVPGLEGFQSARREDGRWVVFLATSGHSIGATAGSRAAAVEDALHAAAQAGADKMAAAKAAAVPCNQRAARADWIKARGLEDAEEAAAIAPADHAAAVVATAQALADAAAMPQEEAAPAILATAEAGAGAELAAGHAASSGREGARDLEGAGATREGARDLPPPVAAREGVQDLEEAPAGREGVQDLQEAAAIAPAALLADIPQEFARRAFHGVSWSPERRGDSYRSDYAATLAADYEHFRQQAAKGGTLAILDEEFSRYREGYRRRMVAWLGSQSRCVSSWIAGPSNFPARRMQKRADVAHARMGEVVEFRERARRAIVRKLRPDLRPIMASDADAADKLAAKIARAEQLQERMRAANAAIRKHKKGGEVQQLAALAELGYSEAQARELLKPDFCGRVGFADYALTNNGANIRRMRERLEAIERAQATAATDEEGADGITLQDDPPANRVRLLFPGKPPQAVRDELKAAGFRWAPSLGAWQAYRNWRTITTARRLAGLAAEPAPAVAVIEASQEAPASQEGAQDLQPAAAAQEGAQDLPQPLASEPERLGPSPYRLELTRPSGAYVAWGCQRAGGGVGGRPSVGRYAEAGALAAPDVATWQGVQDLAATSAARVGVQDLQAKAPAAPTKPARRYVPSIGQRMASKAGAWEAWLYRSAQGVPYLVFYAGRALNPTAHHRYKDDRARMAHLVRLAKAAEGRTAARVEARKARSGPHPLQVGAVLVHTWGYEQTNQDFYEVTALAGKTQVEVRRIAAERHHTGDMAGKCVPCPGQYVGEPMRRRAGPDGYVKIASHGHARPAEIIDHLPDGKPLYRAYSFTEYA